jgi:phosphatidate cytidylyltransferase
MGAIMVALAIGIVALDAYLAGWAPCLLAISLMLAIGGGVELLGLIAPERRPTPVICLGGLILVMAGNWIPYWWPAANVWHLVFFCFAASFLVAFLIEMAGYGHRNNPVERIALTLLVVAYLGVLPTFLIQMRWFASVGSTVSRSTLALLLTIFVPKCGDMGAYATGRLIGRHRMTPALSPKKTWEGSIGGVVVAIIISCVICSYGPRPGQWLTKALGFGLVVGIAGILGDLAESLMKRESQKKDASDSVPGFGGILDVIDSILFISPISYGVLALPMISPIG